MDQIEEEVEVEWGSVCRLCLEEGAGVDLQEGDEALELQNLIRECAGVEVYTGDGLPTRACSSCTGELPLHHAFVMRARRADQVLRAQLIKSEIQVKKEEDGYENTAKCNQEEDNEVHKDACKLISPMCKLENGDNIINNEPEADSHEDTELPMRNDVFIENKTAVLSKKHKKRQIKSNGNQKCKICGLKAKTASAMICHQRVHTGERPYGCLECNARFSLYSTLKSHILRVHRDARTFICEVCGNGFASNLELNVHKRKHTGEKPYSCAHCRKTFSQRGSLIDHIRLHTGERPFACEKCPKRFNTQGRLREHTRVHSDNRPYICDLCGKGFKSRGALRYHTQLHQGEVQYVCDKCNASFPQKGNLVSHISKLHSSRSGHCSKCDKTYSNLVIHMKWHNGESPYVCLDCGRKFSRGNGLKMHCLANHKPQESLLCCPVEGCTRRFALQCMVDFHISKYHLKKPLLACEKCCRGFYRLCDKRNHQRTCLKNTA